MTATSAFTPRGGTPLVVPRLEPIDDEHVSSAPITAQPPERARATARKPLASAVTYENPFATPVPPLPHGGAEPDWPTRHPPSRYTLVLPGAKSNAGPETSSEFNFRGHVALGTGLIAVALVVLLWAFGSGLWWAYVPLGGFAIWSGVRGHDAANRGLATNPWQARAGIVAGAAALVGVLAFGVNLMVTAATISG